MNDDGLGLRYEHAFDIRINFDKRWIFGPISGGAHQGYTSVGAGSTVTGPRLNGRVVDFSGADWGVVRTDGVIELNAHYMLEADDGSRIYIHNRGYIHGPTRSADRDGAQSPMIPSYFRCTPYFRAPEGPHGWLNRTVVIGVGKRMPRSGPDGEPDHTLFRYYAIL